MKIDIIKNFKNIIIFILLVLLTLTQTCKKTVVCPEVKTTIKRDTVWLKKDTIINSKPTLLKTIKYKTIFYKYNFLDITNIFIIIT